jgi:pSer/pThr/pTyr-binding forkhead associated (FHA) protein
VSKPAQKVVELAQLAWDLDIAGFEARLGPIALMQQPARTSRPPLVATAPGTFPLPTLNAEEVPPLARFEELLVATLPPPRPDGTVQLVIGRDPDCDLVVVDPAVSGHHASIQWDGTRGLIVELGSINGTFINLQKIWSRAALQNGDRLSFGLSTFVYLLASDFHARLRRLSPRPG